MNKWKRWVSETFIRKDHQVLEAIGAVRKVKLSPFGYSLEYSGANGDASFELSVEAERESASAFIELQKRGVWEVKFARLIRADKKVIQLVVPQQ